MARGKEMSKLELERIKILAAQGMSQRMIAKKLGRSKTIVATALRKHGEDIEVFTEAAIFEGIDRYTNIIDKALDRVEKSVETEKMSGVAAAKILGIVFDKRQLLKGEPTQIEDSNVTVAAEEQEVRDLVDAFTEFAEGTAEEVQKTSGGKESVPVCAPLPETYSEEEDL